MKLCFFHCQRFIHCWELNFQIASGSRHVLVIVLHDAYHIFILVFILYENAKWHLQILARTTILNYTLLSTSIELDLLQCHYTIIILTISDFLSISLNTHVECEKL